MLTENDIKVFHKGGFTDFEIGMINEGLRERPQKIDPTNSAWQAVFKERLNYIRKGLNAGATLRQIHKKIIAYVRTYVRNRDTGQSPWDFLREAYPIKGGKKTDFNKRVEARAKIKDHIKDHFGKGYR
jgi:hypothetical protein